IILKDKEAITERPGLQLDPVDFDALERELYEKLDREITSFDVIAYALYPDVFTTYENFKSSYADVSVLDTPTYYYGMRLGEEIEVEIEQGKTLFIRLASESKPRTNRTRIMYIELTVQTRKIIIRNKSVQTNIAKRPKADKDDTKHSGATMPGTVIETL